MSAGSNRKIYIRNKCDINLAISRNHKYVRLQYIDTITFINIPTTAILQRVYFQTFAKHDWARKKYED